MAFKHAAVVVSVSFVLSGCIESAPESGGTSNTANNGATNSGTENATNNGTSNNGGATNGANAANATNATNATNNSGATNNGETNSANSQDFPDDWWNTEWPSRSAFELKNGNGEIADFIVNFSLTGNEMDQLVLFDPQQVRFVDDEGNELLHDLEYGAASASFWVRLSTLKAGESRVWMYYGRNDARDTSQPEKVWDQYVGVFHMSNDPTFDSSDGIESDCVDACELSDGVAGRGFQVDGGGNLLLYNTNEQLSVKDGEALTASIWFRPKTETLDWSYLLFAEGGCVGWSLAVGSTYMSAYFTTLDDLGQTEGDTCLEENNPYRTGLDRDGLIFSPTRWHNGTLVIDRTNSPHTLTMYFDGSPTHVEILSSNDSSGPQLARIAADWQDTGRFNGGVDEVFFRREAVSEAAIKAHFENFRTRSFVTFIANPDDV